MFWRAREAWFALKGRFGFTHDPAAPAIPPFEFAEVMRADDPYSCWLLENEARPADLARLREWIELLPTPPRIVIVIDDADPTLDATAAIAAAEAQIYPCTIVRTSASESARAKGDLVARWDAAHSGVTCDVVVWCTVDEILSLDAAAEIALGFVREPLAVFAYGDRDHVTHDGARSEPTFAPDWSPESFLCYPYCGDVLWFCDAAVRAAGGLRSEYGVAARYDLALRLTDRGERAAHRARILHHERSGPESVANFLKGDANTVTHRARVEAIGRRDITADFAPVADLQRAEIVRYAFATSVDREIDIDIVIPTRDHADDLARVLGSTFERSRGDRFAITIVDNGSTEAATHALIERTQATYPNRFRTIRIDAPFNFSQLVNAGVRTGSAPIVLLLNNDTEVLDSDWLESLAGYAARPEIGAVGARLLYPDRTLQHAGVVVGLGELAGHIHRFAEPASVIDPLLHVPRNVAAVTGACLAVRRAAFDSIGGFDESLAVEYNDVDFCLRLAATGLRNICLPHVRLIHFESKSRGADNTSAKRARSYGERAEFKRRYTNAGYVDPYYNPNLTKVDESGAVDVPIWLRGG